MFLSIATTRSDPKALGYLLYKHPDRIFHSSEDRNTKMKVTGFYPEATDERCEFCLVVDVDPVERVRGLAWNAGIAQYVEPQPFLAASYMSQAISLCLRSALNGIVSAKDPEQDANLKRMAVETWPLEITVSPLRTSPALIARLFEPLGWAVELESHALDVPNGKRESDLHTLKLTGTVSVQDALTHLYVLLPTLDPKRHYFYDDSEVEKLLEKSRNWLEGHPSRDLIVNRYLSKSKELRVAAFSRLDEASDTVPEEAVVGETMSAHDARHLLIVEQVKSGNARRIADLGCGEGRLLARLAMLPGDLEIVGVEPAMRDLDKARKTLSKNPGRQIDPRITLMHGSILYSDRRLQGFDTAILSEVIEHIEPERLKDAERCVFGVMQPKTVIVTTPNGAYNAVFGLAPGKFRHSDHRFEWTVVEAAAWIERVSAEYGYEAVLTGVGDHVEEFGHLSHFIVFKKI